MQSRCDWENDCATRLHALRRDRPRVEGRAGYARYRSVGADVVRILKGFHHSAQRCEERATLGDNPNAASTLKELNRFLRGERTRDSTPSELFRDGDVDPG